MPGDIGRVAMAVETDTTKFDAGVEKSEQKAGRLSGTFGKVGGAAKIMGGIVGGATLGALSDFANAAAADEANTIKLQVAIENSGVAYDDYAGQIDAAIKKGQELAFSDDQTRNSLASLTESTGSVEEAMKRLPIAMDLARAKNISLESASKLLGKVSDENTKALKKYGIVMQDGATATDVLAKVQQIAGGQAEAYGNTTKASVEKVKDQIGEFTEGIGASMGPFTGYIALLPGLQAGMAGAGAGVGALSGMLKGTMIPSMLSTIPATLAMMAPFLPIVLVFAGIGLAILALKWAWENNLGDMQGKATAVLSFVTDAFSGFKLFVLQVWRGIVTGIAGAVNGVITVINGFIEAYNLIAQKLGLPLLGKIEMVTPNLTAIDAEIDAVAADRTARINVSYNVPPMPAFGVMGPYHSGTDFVPRTGLALLERGEAVIPAEMNRRGFGARALGPVGHSHDIIMDGRVVAGAIGERMNADRRVRGGAAA